MPQEWIMEEALKKWGEEKQLLMVVEEMGELSHAILKYLRAPDEHNREEIAREHADVSIMLDQLAFMMLKHDPNYTIKKRWATSEKVTRLVNRLDEGK